MVVFGGLVIVTSPILHQILYSIRKLAGQEKNFILIAKQAYIMHKKLYIYLVLVFKPVWFVNRIISQIGCYW